MPNLFLNLWGTTKLFLNLMCPKPLSWAKKLMKTQVEENLRIKNTTQRNSVTDQNQNWTKRTTFKS